MDVLESRDPRQLGSFEILGRLGWSPLGQAYMGRSAAAGQASVTAIDIGLTRDPYYLTRLEAGLTAARKVTSRFTAHVLETDLTGPQPWLATTYLTAPSLADAVATRGPLPSGPLLDLAAGLAEGLAAIHDTGITHGDMKPADVLLAEDGPRLANFWISGTVPTAILAGDGHAGGFTSPEQAQGRAPATASDVFSLAAILIYAATGNGPFAAGTTDAMNYQILYYDPPLQAIPPQIRPLLARCLAKNPADRPTSRQLLAELAYTRASQATATTDNLKNWLNPPSPAWPPPAPRPGPQPSRRVPTTAIAAIIMAAASVVIIVLGNAALSSGGGNQPGSVSGDTTLASLSSSVTAPFEGGQASVAFSPDGQWIATLDGGSVYLWDSSTEAQVATFPPSANAGIDAMAFSPDGKFLATSDTTGTTQLWNVSSQSVESSVIDPSPSAAPVAGSAAAVAFDPKGKFFATVDSASGNALVWTTAGGSLVATYSDPGDGAFAYVAFSPDGKTIAVSDNSDNVYLWNISASGRIGELAGTGTSAQSVAFSPDGKVIAVGDGNGSTYLWDVARRTLITRLANPGPIAPGTNVTGIVSVAFGPNGRLLATAGNNGNICLWNAVNHRKLATLTDPDNQELDAIAFSPDGSALAASDANGTTYLWQINRPA